LANLNGFIQEQTSYVANNMGLLFSRS